jgi:hypothetical protein
MEEKPSSRPDLMDERLRKPVTLHPSWSAFIEFCSRLQHGEIERLTIQNGLPVLAEQTRKKVKFSS